MKKIKTKTQSGIQVILSITEDRRIQATFIHPQHGTHTIIGSWRKCKQSVGFFGYWKLKDSNVYLTIPKSDYDLIAIPLEDEKEAERIARYKELVEKLPPVPDFSNTPDKEKFNRIMKKIKNIYFSGPEDDGLNIAMSAANGRVRAEARQYCTHDIHIEFNYAHTADARKKVIRTISCEKCGMYMIDIVEEEVSIDAIWR